MNSKNNDICAPQSVIGLIGNKWNLLIIWHLND